MSILSGNEIARQVNLGEIEIDPFDDSQVNPASYDLRLGDTVIQYDTGGIFDVKDPSSMPVLPATKIGEGGMVLFPGRFYLMHTAERICTRRYVPVLDGKSSVGRLGVFIHVTAGYGDPGFNGQYTLEVATLRLAVRVYPGMKFAQVRFHELIGDHIDYQERGSYVGARSTGPVPSQIYRQFIVEERKKRATDLCVCGVDRRDHSDVALLSTNELGGRCTGFMPHPQPRRNEGR